MTFRAAAVAVLLLPGLAAAQLYPPPPPPGPPPPPPPPPHHRAEGPADTGLTLGLRAGWGTPSGDVSHEGDPRLDDLVDSKVPIWFDLGFRFSPAVWGGLYVEYAPVSVASAFCDPARSCGGSSVRFGIDLQLHLAPRRPLDPWVGIGFGAEFLSADTLLDTTGDGRPDVLGNVSYGGVEAPLLEAGLDIALSPRFSVGPWASWSFAWFTSRDTEVPGFGGFSEPIHGSTYHGWLELGLKVSFKL
jgi:hypothetical protein